MILDDQLARRNALVLAVAQALFSATTIVLIATGGLVGLMLAPDKGLATLPLSTFVIGSMIATIPASLLMQKYGRRAGFMGGAIFGIVAALLGAWAVVTANFTLFCVAAALHGVFQATSGFFRFAAADNASAAFKPKAISWVLTGGVAAALIGTLTAWATTDLFMPYIFAGSFVASAGLSVLCLGVLAFIRLPKPLASQADGPARPLLEIIRQPRLIVAVAAAMLAYGMMSLMMTATPIAMVACGFSKDASFWVIQWHVFAMFVPSFFTGHLIASFGAGRISAIGMLLLASAAVVALLGIGFDNFAVALVLLGLGWNFGFIGGTTMLTDCYRPAERGKVQALNDFAISATMAVASLSAGQLLEAWGWNAVAYALFPMAALALALILWRGMARTAAA